MKLVNRESVVGALIPVLSLVFIVEGAKAQSQPAAAAAAACPSRAASGPWDSVLGPV